MIDYFPRYFSNRAIMLYSILLIAVTLVFWYPMHWYWWIIGIIEVAGFFYFSSAVSRDWRRYSSKIFERKLFRTSVVIRLVFVVFSYFFYLKMTGTPFEFSAGDALGYHNQAIWGIDVLRSGENLWNATREFSGLSDMGYPLYLTLVYCLTGKSIIITRIIKAFISAYTVVLIYRLASRNIGEDGGRIAAIFCMLMPNLIYYCGVHLKETEMLFLTVLFVERADAIFRTNHVKLLNVVTLFIIGGLTYFFRAVLCYVLFLTLGASIVFGSKRLKKGAKWTVGIFLAALFIAMGGFDIGNGFVENDEYQNVMEQQQGNMQWRADREGGNSYAQYASADIFAPLIFTIPFPTMVNIDGQENQQFIHGGNYVKNITSFFTMLAIIMLLFSGKWRDNVTPLAFMIGYLMVLVFSSFAQSERFHIPSLPFELMFAAYAITQFKAKHKPWFTIWLFVIFVANMGWSWIKLRGRGF